MSNGLINDAIDAVVSGIQNYQPLIDFCTDSFGKTPYIEFGVDRNRLPGKQKYPAVLILESPSKRSGGDGSVVLTVQTVLAIEDEGVDNTDPSYTEYAYLRKINTFGHLVYEAVEDHIFGTLSTNVDLVDFDFEAVAESADDRSTWPMISAGLDIRFVLQEAIGQKLTFK